MPAICGEVPLMVAVALVEPSVTAAFVSTLETVA